MAAQALTVISCPMTVDLASLPYTDHLTSGRCCVEGISSDVFNALSHTAVSQPSPLDDITSRLLCKLDSQTAPVPLISFAQTGRCVIEWSVGRTAQGQDPAAISPKASPDLSSATSVAPTANDSPVITLTESLAVETKIFDLSDHRLGEKVIILGIGFGFVVFILGLMFVDCWKRSRGSKNKPPVSKTDLEANLKQIRDCTSDRSTSLDSGVKEKSKALPKSVDDPDKDYGPGCCPLQPHYSSLIPRGENNVRAVETSSES